MHKIRIAEITDIPLIRELCLQVWPQTYASIITPEQIDYMLNLMYSAESLQQQMESGARFIVVYEDEVPVGFASYQHTGPGLYKLHKLYVLPSQQGKGTGRFVINHILEEISAAGASILQLQVNKYNKARIFYEKMGFVAVQELMLEIGNGFYMDDYIMELKLPAAQA